MALIIMYNLRTMGVRMYRMFMRGAALALAFVCLLPALAFSADIAGRSRTLLTDQETVFKENLLRLYEYVDLAARDIGDNKISVQASGWGRYDFDTPVTGDRDDGELSYAYVSMPIEPLHARVNFGRQYITMSAAPEQVDGLYLSSRISGFGIDVFGGSPPSLDADNRSGDSIYGGRLSHQMPGVYEIGASYLKEQNDSTDFREEYSGDIWLSPVSWLNVEGQSLYNNETDGWAEHSYRLNLGVQQVKLYGEYSKVDYEHFFQATTTDAFSSVLISPKESYDATGGGLVFSFSNGAQVIGHYKHYSYDIAGDADTYGGDINYAGEMFSAGVSAGRTNGDVDELKYDLYRAFISASGDTLDVTLDGVLVAYDVKINDTKQSVAATATLGYKPVKNLRVGVDGTYSETPEFKNETRGMFTIDYEFGEL